MTFGFWSWYLILESRWQRSKEENAILSKVGGNSKVSVTSPRIACLPYPRCWRGKGTDGRWGSDGVACGLVTGWWTAQAESQVGLSGEFWNDLVRPMHLQPPHLPARAVVDPFMCCSSLWKSRGARDICFHVLQKRAKTWCSMTCIRALSELSGQRGDTKLGRWMIKAAKVRRSFNLVRLQCFKSNLGSVRVLARWGRRWTRG